MGCHPTPRRASGSVPTPVTVAYAIAATSAGSPRRNRPSSMALARKMIGALDQRVDVGAQSLGPVTRQSAQLADETEEGGPADGGGERGPNHGVDLVERVGGRSPHRGIDHDREFMSRLGEHRVDQLVLAREPVQDGLLAHPDDGGDVVQRHRLHPTRPEPLQRGIEDAFPRRHGRTSHHPPTLRLRNRGWTRQAGSMRRWVVDAFNVLGARPDGWWRDRPGALGRLMDEIIRWRAATGEPVLVMIDGRPHPMGPPEGTWYGIDTRYTGRSDRDAADDAIVDLLHHDSELAALRADVIVATSDRDLVGRVTALGATTEGAGAFRRRLANIAERRADQVVLAAFGIDESALIGRGGEARVFALDDERVVRLPHPGVSDEALDGRRAFLDGLAPSVVSFDLPRVLEHRVVAGRTVVIERRLSGEPAHAVLNRRGADRSTLIRSCLDAAAAIAAVPDPGAGTGFGERLRSAAGPTTSFGGWAHARVTRSLASAGPTFGGIDATALTDGLLAALADPEPSRPVLVHLDTCLSNMLAIGSEVTAVLDFGPTVIGGPPDLDPLAAIAYLAPEITPGATADDRAVAMTWAAELGLAHAVEPAERWLAAYWAWADDDERLHAWCRRILAA